MKTLGIALSLCACICYSQTLDASSRPLPYEKNISFYQTNLVCGAAPDIGCGTRAKPVLRDFQKDSRVEEAWLNHAGTVIGVVWKENVSHPEKIATEVFGKHHLEYTDLEGKDYDHELSDFEKGRWYRGDDVDGLSRIEASRIAEHVMADLAEDIQISPEDQNKMQEELEDYFSKELLSIQDDKVIYDLDYWLEWDKGINKIGEKYVGKGNMPAFSICSSYGFDEETLSKAAKSCSPGEKSCSSSCCSH